MIPKIIICLIICLICLGQDTVANASTLVKKRVDGYSVYIIEISQKDSVSVVVGNEKRVGGAISVNQMVNQNKATGGINSGFFKMDTRLPLGIIYKNNQLYTGTLFDRSALIGYKNNTYEIKRLHFEGIVKRGWGKEDLSIDSYNQPRLSRNQVMIYDSKWTSFVSSIFKNGRLIVVQNNIIVCISSKGVKVPTNGYVIYGPAHKVDGLRVGDKVDFTYKISDLDLKSIKFIVSGGPRLIQDKGISNNIGIERFSCNSVCYSARRTAVGIKDGKLYFIVVPQAISLSKFSWLLMDLGLDQAVNFDGGGSTQMTWQGRPIIQGRLVNNGLIVY